MYETYFGLKRRPFLAVPDTDSYFSVDAVEEARRTIQRTVRRGEGVSLIFGPSGTGKTLLLRLLRQSLEVDFAVSLIANGHLETPKAFFQQLLFDLRLPYSGSDEAELRLQLLDFARQETAPGLAVLIDESQFLDRSVLEEIRILMNCDDGATPFFRAVLAGTPEFEEKLTHPRLTAFNQRIVSRSYLEPFTKEETYHYIEWQSNLSRGKVAAEPESTKDVTGDDDIPDPALGLAEFIKNSGTQRGHRVDSPHVKGSEPIFTMSARRQIHQLTEGVPRLINQLCDISLQLAAERVLRQVDDVLVHSAWARFQQLDETEAARVAAEAEMAATAPVDIDEIVARKKATFQPKIFDSAVQFGILDDSKTVAVEPEPAAVVEEAVMETAVVEVDSTEIEVTEETTEEVSEEESLYLVRASLKPVRRKRTVGDFFQKCSRLKISSAVDDWDGLARFLRHRVSISWTFRQFETLEPWIGNVVLRPMFQPSRLILSPTIELDVEAEIVADSVEEEAIDIMETQWPGETETGIKESPMDLETLERYGAEILEGRPPFVRKEPNYAYDTSEFGDADHDADREAEGLEYPYPDSVTGGVIVLRWIQPEPHQDTGFGTSYSDYLLGDTVGPDVVDDEFEPAIAAEPETVGSVVRLAMTETPAADSPAVSTGTAIDERFDEIVTVLRQVVAIEELYHSEPARPAVKSATENSRSAWDDPAFQRQVEAIVKRITEAAGKIEQAAEVSEEAGRHVRRAADFVEREVQAALPTYIDLFQELSEFQKTVTDELTFIREMNRISNFVGPFSEGLLPTDERTGITEAKLGKRQSQLLPFPRRPDFGSIEPPTAKEDAKRRNTDDDAVAEPESSSDESSIDVRSLFQ